MGKDFSTPEITEIEGGCNNQNKNMCISGTDGTNNDESGTNSCIVGTGINSNNRCANGTSVDIIV